MIEDLFEPGTGNSMSMLPVPQTTETAEGGPRKVATAICRNVMAALGRPEDFLRVTVRQVTSAGHRVNVYAGADVTSARIAHSFFVTADGEGNLTDSSPVIVKQY